MGISIKKHLGQIDLYIDTLQKYGARVSTIMIWVGFFTYMSTIFDVFWLIIVLIALICVVVFLVWFDVKFIIPSKQEYLGKKNPFLMDMWKDLKK